MGLMGSIYALIPATCKLLPRRSCDVTMYSVQGAKGGSDESAFDS